MSDSVPNDVGSLFWIVARFQKFARRLSEAPQVDLSQMTC